MKWAFIGNRWLCLSLILLIPAGCGSQPMKHRHPCLPVLELEYVCEDVCEYARMDAELLVTADWVPCKRLLMRSRTAAFGDNMYKKSPVSSR